MKPEFLNEVPEEPILVTRFQEIRQIPERSPNIEDFQSIFEDEQYRVHCFQEALNAFKYVYNKEKLDNYIQAEPSKEGAKYLKQVRRYGLILKATYNFFDSEHQCPENLNSFLKNLGRYNDNYWLPESHRNDVQLAELSSLDMELNLAPTEEFKEHVKTTLSHIEWSFDQPVLSVENFHKLRKKIRLCANFMQVTAAEYYQQDLHWLFASLHEISDRLGKEHDELVQKGLMKEIDYHISEMEIEPADKEDFARLKPYIQKVVGI
jgi:hypothetical protein